MFYIRPANERGNVNIGWLDSKHSFSFGNYYEPKHMGFGALRVINEDRVMPGAGFDTHGHRDMEIISYVLAGAIEHKDSMGNQFVVPAGDIQRMSAGTGVMHSEFNHSKTEAVHFLQIWIEPAKKNIEPGYEQKTVAQKEQMTALVTPDGREDSLSMHQDASLYRLQLQAGEQHRFNTSERPGYLHVISGNARLADKDLGPGDAMGAHGETFEVHADSNFVALWFDLPSHNH